MRPSISWADHFKAHNIFPSLNSSRHTLVGMYINGQPERSQRFGRKYGALQQILVAVLLSESWKLAITKITIILTPPSLRRSLVVGGSCLRLNNYLPAYSFRSLMALPSVGSVPAQ